MAVAGPSLSSIRSDMTLRTCSEGNDFEYLRVHAAAGARQATVSANSEASSSRSNGDAWEFVTDQGLPFFRNKITGDVSWTPPPGVNYVAASAAVTAAAAAVPAAVAAANTATTAAAPARPALRILSVKKPVKQECPNTKVPVPPCTAGAPTAAASAAAAPTTTVCTAAAPAAEAPATPAGAEAQLASASAVPAAVVVERDAGVASSAAASTAPVHAARTAQTSAFAGVAAGVYAPVAAGGPVADAAFAPVEEMPDFIPLSRSTSSGSSSIPAGYVFKKGHRGLGFYKDRPPQQQHCHQQWQQRRGSGNRPVQHNWGHAQQRKQQSAQQQQQRMQYGQQLQQHTLQDRQQQQQQRTPLKRPREEADAESSSPPADAAAAIAAAAAEAAAAAATLWGPGAAATEEQDSRSGNEGGVAAGTVETGEGLALDLPKAPYRAPKTTADESAQVAAGGSHRSDNGTRVHGDNSEEAEEEREDATAAAAAEDEFAAATTQRRVVVQTEGPVIGPWVEAKEDGWDAIARRQQQEQEQLLLLQQQQQEDALEHGEERRVNAGGESCRMPIPLVSNLCLLAS